MFIKELHQRGAPTKGPIEFKRLTPTKGAQVVLN